MREILFRGQRRKYGQKVRMGDGEPLPGIWVYGGVLQGTGDFSIIYGGENPDKPSEGLNKWPVYTDTLGQYTGLKDKNGQRIFEGDIIAVPFEEDRSPWEENCVYYENGKVYFCDEHHGWYVDFGDDALSIWECDGAGVYDDFGVEVIGNIHDNPELLKTEE